MIGFHQRSPVPLLARSLAAAFLCASAVADAQPTPAQQNAIRQSCRSDYMAHCSSVTPGGSEALACLQQHGAQLSGPCQQALAAIKSASAPKAAPAPQAASMQAPMPSSAQSWPHT
ncbi:MAG TPA: cysteine rich repeat-containing protein, partial [Casimicrobiaceae bacterium]